MTMASSSTMMAAEEQQQCRMQRIEAFKDKVADLCATSKVYNITSDVSIHTLDSSLATKTVNSTSSSNTSSYMMSSSEVLVHRNTVDPRKKNTNNISSVDAVVWNAGKTLSESAAVISKLSSMEEKRSPVEEEEETEEEEHHDDDDGSSGCFSVDSFESRLSPPENTSIHGNDEEEDDDDEGDSKGSFDGALFSELRNAMFQRQMMVKKDVDKPEEEEEEKETTTTERRPEVVTHRSVSQSSKQSIADATSSGFSSSGGFSIECIEEDGSEDSVELILQPDEEEQDEPEEQEEDGGSVEEKPMMEHANSPVATPIDDTKNYFSGLSIASSLSSKSKPATTLLESNVDDGATDQGYSHRDASRRLRELVAIISQDDFLEKAISTDPIDKLFSGQSVNSSLSTTSKPMACLLSGRKNDGDDDEDDASDEGYAHYDASRRLRELVQQRQMGNGTTVAAAATTATHGQEEAKEDENEPTPLDMTTDDIEGRNASQRLRKLIAIGKECIEDGSGDSKGSIALLSEPRAEMTATTILPDEEVHIGDMDIRGTITATDISHNDSMSSMTDQPPTAVQQQPPVQEENVLASSSNPFAVLLKLRQARKMAASNKLSESVGSINLGHSSDEDSSMSSLSAFKTETDKKVTTVAAAPKVYTDTDRAGDMLERVLFSNLKQSLSKIQSVDYEESYENTTDEEVEEDPYPTENVKVEEEDEEDDDDDDDEEDMGENRKCGGIASSVVVDEMESCAISSLKDETFVMRSLNDYGVEMNDDPFLDDDDNDDDDEVNSVPTSPAALEDYGQFQTSNGSNYSNSFDNTSMSDESDKEGVNKTESLVNKKTRRGLVNNDDDGDTVTFSNSNKVDFMHQKDRETILTPPKRNVIISDGSVYTKDSILGKTINVATADLASERIFLESLRAQVLAELKVHVADEEIRSALDARLKAIQNYYKRKATVVTLSKASNNSAASSRHDYDEFLNSLGSIPKVQRTAIHDNKVKAPSQVLSSSSPNAHPSQQQEQQHSHQFAFERAQWKMDEALRAAHKKKRNSSDFPQVVDDDDEDYVDKENPNQEINNSQSETEATVPGQIFMKDTFWDDEDDPSTGGGSPGTGEVESDRPPTHADTVQNAWNFYRDINNLIFDSRVYDYEFQLVQDDPLFPYLNSLLGVADSGDVGGGHEHEHISQKVKAEYADKSPHRICHILAKEANDAMPELKEICAYLGEKLGMQTMAVGPMKKPSEALLKCERKYGGDPLLVLDYCRASLFVKDIATLLALIEIVLSEYGQILRRIKLSSLKSDHIPLTGGYRDCKINIDIGGHICEIQVHLIPLWLIKEGSGYGHYKKCCDHSVNMSSFDIGKTLDGLSRSVLKDLIDIADYELKSSPIISLEKYSEDKIRDYFALACMYQCYGKPAKAEYILRRTVKLRSESSKFGLCHNETMLHLEVLRQSLKSQHKYKSSMKIKSQITKMKRMQRRGDTEPELFQLCSEDQCGAMDHLCDLMIDPSKSERRREKQKARDVEESRALWLRMRKSFFN